MLLAFTVVRTLIQFRTGPFAYVTIFEPHLFGLLALLAIVLLWARRPIPAAIVAVALLVGVVRVGSEWISLPVETSPDDLVVITWNLHIGSRPPDESVAALLRDDLEADVVALQELTDDVAATIEADPAVDERYPYWLLYPTNNTLGMGVLSRYPLAGPHPFVVRRAWRSWSKRRVPRSRSSTRIRRRRDSRRWSLRPRAPRPRDRPCSRSDRRRTGARRSVIVVGDYNVTPTEPAYRDLVEGLRDVHTDAGLGPGWTWRPKRVEPLGIGVLRIDYVFAGPGLEPVSSSVRCPPTGDHCLVISRISSQ